MTSPADSRPDPAAAWSVADDPIPEVEARTVEDVRARSQPWWVVALVLLVVGGAASLTMDVVGTLGGIKGDESTYVSMALSVAHDGDLRFDRGDLQRFWAEYGTGPEGIFLKRGRSVSIDLSAGWPFVTLRAIPDPPAATSVYYGKAFIYPVLAAPFVWAAGLNGLVLFNVLLLVGVGVLGSIFLAVRGAPAAATLFTSAYLGASIAPLYAVWLTPEVFNFALVFYAYFLWFHKETAGRATPVRGWLEHPATDLLAALVLGLATFSKPINVLLIGPPVLWLLSRRRFRHGTAVGLVFGLTIVSLFAVNALVSGDPNYQGGERKTFYGAFPFDEPGQGFDERGIDVATDDVGLHMTLEPEMFWTRLGLNLGYFFVGRHAGLVPYYFPAIVTIVLCLVHWRGAPLWRWLLLGAAAVTALGLLVWIPFTWAGGGGPPGNRYYLSVYPVIFFATPPLTSLVPGIIAWIGGALFTAQILVNPFTASKRPWLNTVSGPARLLPVEVTMVNDLPVMINGARARVPYGRDPQLLLYFLDDHAYSPEPAGIWIAGRQRADIIVRTGMPLDHLRIRMRSLVDNSITITAGGPGRTASVPAGSVVQVAVPVESTLTRGGHGFVLSVDVADGAVPRLVDPRSRDRRFLGVLLQIEGVPRR